MQAERCAQRRRLLQGAGAGAGAMVSLGIVALPCAQAALPHPLAANPQPLAVRFDIPVGTEPFVATRTRMAASGTVYAAVRTDEGLFAAVRSVQVRVGGCA